MLAKDPDHIRLSSLSGQENYGSVLKIGFVNFCVGTKQ